MLQSLPTGGDQLVGQVFDVGGHVLCVDLAILVEVVEVYRNRVLGCQQIGRVKSPGQMASR